MMTPVRVLWQDNHCLVLDKPAGWLTMGDATGDRTLLDAAKAYVKDAYHKPGAVYLGVVHRLDRPVSGVLLFARTSKAASRLSAQFRDHKVEKVYWAAVAGHVSSASGELVDHVVKDSERNVVSVASAEHRAAQQCRLAFRRLAVFPGITLLEIRPQTGRSHQIRVQLAQRGWHIIGDAKYGSQQPFAAGQIALHARALTFEHPTKAEPVTVEAAPPSSWKRWSLPGG